MPRPSNSRMASATGRRKATRPSRTTPSQSVLSRSQTMHLRSVDMEASPGGVAAAAVPSRADIGSHGGDGLEILRQQVFVSDRVLELALDLRGEGYEAGRFQDAGFEQVLQIVQISSAVLGKIAADPAVQSGFDVAGHDGACTLLCRSIRFRSS